MKDVQSRSYDIKQRTALEDNKVAFMENKTGQCHLVGHFKTGLSCLETGVTL